MSEEENIYQKLAQATARAVDIQLGKTTLAELLDGYTKYIVLQGRIDKALEYINTHDLYIEVVDYDYEENPETTMIRDDIAKEDLSKILKGENYEENEIIN